MADFAKPTKTNETVGAKGSLPKDNTEHQAPPVLHLSHHHLEALGMKQMPAVGSKVKISGLAHVGATSEHQDNPPSGGKLSNATTPSRSMTLHLHQMEMGADSQPGMTDVQQEDQAKAGAKAEMDKALSKAASGDKSDKSKPAGGKKGTKGG